MLGFVLYVFVERGASLDHSTKKVLCFRKNAGKSSVRFLIDLGIHKQNRAVL